MIKKSNFKKFLNWNTLLVLILSAEFVYLFVQNFVFSSSYEMTLLRHIDDYVFNQSMHYWQRGVTLLHFGTILKMNHFAYGWIFWALHGIITFPFYLLGNETMVISTARNISLCFSFGTLFLLYKILNNYTKNDFYKFLIILSVAFCPAFILYSLSFSNAMQATFFAVLGVFFLLKNKTLHNRDIVFSSLFLGIAVATKLTGAFLLPFAGLIILDRVKFSLNKSNLKKILIFFVVFIISTIVFTDPGLLFSFVYKDEYIKLISIYRSYMQQNLFNHGFVTDSSWWMFFKRDICYSFYGFFLFFVYLGLFVLKIISDLKEKKYDFLYLLIMILIVIFYLITTVKIGYGYIPKYFITVAIFLPFSLLVLEKFGRKGYVIASIFFCMTLYHASVNENNFNFYFRKQKSEQTKFALSYYSDLQKLIKHDENKELNIIAHYSLLVPYSGFRQNVNIISLFDVFPLGIKNVDYIILNKTDPAFWSDAEIKKLAVAEKVFNNKKNILNLVKNGKYEDAKYKLIYEKYNVLVFQKVYY